jgi:AcrR family transcriptional regulator
MPTDHQIDRRVQRTRQALRTALIALIEERGFNTLTVQEIADRANINRVTFYFHFRDKEELLFATVQSLYEELESENNTLALSVIEWAFRDALSAFNHAQTYADFYRVLLSEKGLISFMGKLIDYFAETTLREDQKRLPADAEPPLPLDMVEHFYAGAFVGLMRWWLLRGMPYSPEQMAHFCHQLELQGGRWALGLKPSE